MTGAVLALWLVLRLFWLSQLQAEEALWVRKDLTHAGAALNHYLDAMDTLVRDWAVWDATYSFMVTRSPQYARENLVAGTWDTLQVDVLVLCDTGGKLVAGRGYDLSAGRWLPVPEELLAQLRPSGRLNLGGAATNSVTGILQLPGGPMLVAASPILASNHKGPSRGVLLVGRYLNAKVLSRLADASGLILTVHHFSDAPRLVRSPSTLADLQAGLPVVEPQGLDRVLGYAPLRDLSGKPALLLSVDEPRSTYLAGLSTMGYTLLAFLLVGGMLALAVARIMEGMVLSRLARLINEVDRIGAEVNSKERVTVTGQDELSALAQAVNSMLGALDQSREELAASERRFRDIATSTSDWIWEVDAAGRHTFCSDRVTDVLGRSPAELRGTPLIDIVASEQVDRVQAILSEAMARREPLTDLEFWGRTSAGDHVIVQVSAVPVLGPEGGLLGYRGVGQNITAQRRAEEAQRLAAVGELAGGVAHEFNNILTAMSMSAEFVALSPDPARVRKLVETTLAGTSRGAEICRNLLRVARPDEPRREMLWVEEPISAALSMAERELANAGLKVARQQTGEPWPVFGDARQLEQAFLNLIINACQNSPAGGALAINAAYGQREDGHGEVAVTVADTGKGIRPEHLSRVFEPFFTTRSTDALGARRGTGLGLAVVHSIVGAHAGTVSVRSRLGVGTTFEIRLQTHEAAVAQAHAEPLAARLALTRCPHPGIRVLVVDDEAEIRDMLREALEGCGYEVAAAGSAEEAETMLRQAPFGAILTDLQMPGGGGRVVLRLAAETVPPPRIIVMTGHGEADVADEVGALGASELVCKPFNITQIAEAVRRALDSAPPPAGGPQETSPA